MAGKLGHRLMQVVSFKGPRVWAFFEGIISYNPHTGHTTSWSSSSSFFLSLSLFVLVLHNTQQPCISS